MTTTSTTSVEETARTVRLSKDLRAAAKRMGPAEARSLVWSYYAVQQQRIRECNHARSLRSMDVPSDLVEWAANQSRNIENALRSALGAYAKSSRLGRWCLGVNGIGPVLAAGLLAHIDFSVPAPGNIWRFAGLDPSIKWVKGGKRPWNADLKKLCWKIGESFVMQSGRSGDFYGGLLMERKEYEQRRNEEGAYADQAAAAAKRVGAATEAYAYYSAGRLSPGHVHSRAKRWAVKLFLSHLWEVAYWIREGTEPPRPYVFEHLGHVHRIQPPNWP